MSGHVCFPVTVRMSPEALLTRARRRGAAPPVPHVPTGARARPCTPPAAARMARRPRLRRRWRTWRCTASAPRRSSAWLPRSWRRPRPTPRPRRRSSAGCARPRARAPGRSPAWRRRRDACAPRMLKCYGSLQRVARSMHAVASPEMTHASCRPQTRALVQQNCSRRATAQPQAPTAAARCGPPRIGPSAKEPRIYTKYLDALKAPPGSSVQLSLKL